MALIMSSCNTTLRHYEQYTVTDVVDYSTFQQNGIFVTESNSVSFEYQPIGSVVSVTRGAAEEYINYLITTKAKRVDMEKAFAEIGKKLLDMNADGLINMRIRQSFEDDFYYLTITGMAIKRLDGKEEQPRPVYTFKEKIGEIDGISLKVMEAYQSGTKVVTSRELNADQVKEAWKRFFYKQPHVQFYTADGWKEKRAYMGIVDSNIIDYKTNNMMPIE